LQGGLKKGKCQKGGRRQGCGRRQKTRPGLRRGGKKVREKKVGGKGGGKGKKKSQKGRNRKRKGNGKH